MQRRMMSEFGNFGSFGNFGGFGGFNDDIFSQDHFFGNKFYLKLNIFKN